MMEKKFNLIYALLSLLVVVVIAQSYALYDYTKKVDASKELDHKIESTHPFKASSSDPFVQMRIMQEEMQKSFGHINSLFAEDPFFKDAFRGVGISPLSNIIEDKDAYRVEINIPGAKEQKIDIQTQGNHLVIKASVEKRVDTNETNYIHMERYSQRFHRSFLLPQDADLNAFTHSYENGVLEIRVPKKDSL